MRRTLVLIALLLTAGGKLDRLSSTERDHYDALKVYMTDKDRKAYLKLKTEDARNGWLKERDLWDRFYQYDTRMRDLILRGKVSPGWSVDQVWMAWGKPHERLAVAGRKAAKSERLIYRFEVDKEGQVFVWTPGSKVTHTAVSKYRQLVTVDDGVVAEIEKKSGW